MTFVDSHERNLLNPFSISTGNFSFPRFKSAHNQSYSANDALVPVRNKNVITLHEKKSLIVAIYQSSPQRFVLLFSLFFLIFSSKNENLIGCDEIW